MTADSLADGITARAIAVERVGSTDALSMQDRAIPPPQSGQLLVKVSAGGVNFIDIYQRDGTHDMEFPFVAGLEGAGVVESVGSNVTGISVGDRVAWPSIPQSGYTTHALVDADAVIPIPSGVTDETAAAAMLQGLTAHYLATTTYPTQSGETALVHAGAGGVGLLLTQLLTHRGVRVITTVSTAAKEELSRQAGAAEVIRYGEVDFADEVLRLTQNRGLPVVYDGVGRATYEDSLRCLRPRGMLVLFGAASGPVPPIDPRTLELGGSLFLTRPTLRHYIASPEELRTRADEIFQLIATGDLHVRIGGRYPLARAAQAQEDLAARRSTGKLLIIPSAD